MLVDFLKGNHLTKMEATMPWQRAASRGGSSSQVGGLRLDTMGSQYLWGSCAYLLVGPDPSVGPGRWLRAEYQVDLSMRSRLAPGTRAEQGTPESGPQVRT